MRGLTAALIGAALILTAVALLMRRGERPEERPADAVSATGAAAPSNPVREPASHSGRVEERLARLRLEYEERRAASANPAPNKRGVPAAAARAADRAAPAPLPLDPEDVEELAELERTLRHDPDPDERIGAILLLSGSEGPESMHLLTEATGDPDPEVRLAAVEALGDRAEELQPQALIKPLSDADAEVRFEAVSILGDMESPDALQLVKGALHDPDDDVRTLAEGILDFADEEEGATGAKRPVD